MSYTPEAWAITKGSAEIKIAVLDEGVDVTHPALSPALVAQKDFIGGNGNSAMPSGNDAHGTACAGIVVSRDTQRPGIAKGCSLRNPGDIASTGRNRRREGQDIGPVSQLFVEYARKVAKPCQTELNVSPNRFWRA